MIEKRLIEKILHFFEKKYRIKDLFVGNAVEHSDEEIEKSIRFRAVEPFVFVKRSSCYDIDGKRRRGFAGLYKFEKLFSKEMLERGWTQDTMLTKRQLKAFREEMLDKYDVKNGLFDNL